MTRVIGIDLGATQLRAALVDDGRLIRRAATLTDVKGGPRAVLAQMLALMDEVAPPAERASVKSIGVCSPGPLDSETGVVLYISTMPGWEDFALRDELARAAGLPVVVDNDGVAAAFGEWRHGAGRGLRHLVYVTVSTGIGGGAVIDGHLVHGRRGMAPHVGHLRLGDGPRCSCGMEGCFEAFASGSALGQRARASAARNPAGVLARSERIDARAVVEGARRGDAECAALIGEEARYLGLGFVTLLHLFSPDAIIVGGGVSDGLDLMQPGIRAIIRRDALPPFKDVPVVRAGLGGDAGLIGAAALAAEQIGPS